MVEVITVKNDCELAVDIEMQEKNDKMTRVWWFNFFTATF